MPRTNAARTIFAALLLLAAAAIPAFAARGSADFTRYVALGDSYGAGFSNNSLVVSHQLWSYPAVIARQAGLPICGPDPGCIGFQQPLVSEPGIPPELEIKSIVPSVVIAPKASQSGQPINLMLQRPYNNLSVPGFRAGHLLAVTGAEPSSGAAQFILRGLGTAVQQAIALHPTFVTVWIGGNDVLGAVGGGSPSLLTPIADFRAAYAGILDALIAGAPTAGIIVGTIPDPLQIPFVHVVPPYTTLADGQKFYFVADLGGGQIGQLTADSLLTLNAIALLGQGYGVPTKPLPDAVVLTPAEMAAIRTRAAEVNAAIRDIAGSRDIPVVEVERLNGVFQGIDIAGIELNASFVTGGIFSLDGVHLTDIGYTLFANEYIEAINEAWNTDIPLASITPFFQNNAPREGLSLLDPRAPFTFPPESLRSILGVMQYSPGASIPQQPSRRRGVGRF